MQWIVLGVSALIPIVAFAVENPLEWEFRLAGGTTGLNGRVEMRPNSTAPWGTICKDIFKENSFGSIAACNSAGLVGVTQAVYKTTYGAGTGPIYLTDVSCTASTTFIQNCSRSPLLQTGACVHFEDVGVDCSPPPHMWQFKMVNGTAPSNGIVLIKPMPSLPWGSLKMDPFLYNNIEPNREVMCRTLGYNTTRATATDPRFLGVGSDLPSYLNVQCTNPSTPFIGSCVYSPFGETTWAPDSVLALDCNPPPPKPIGPVEVQLVNGATASSGFIWIRANSTAPWQGMTPEDLSAFMFSTPLLTTPISSTQREILIAVCAAAGFPGATAPMLGKYGIRFPPVLPPYLHTNLIGMNINCSGAATFAACTVGPNRFTGFSKGSGGYAGVDCFPNAYNFSQWEFRLAGNGASTTIGRVELRPNNTAPWLGVCNGPPFADKGSLWTALCRQMGFNATNAVRSQLNLPLSNHLYYLGLGINDPCPSDANGRFNTSYTLADCALSPIGMHLCSTGKDLTMDCGFPDISQMQLRLVNSAKPGAGRLEVRPGDSYDWGTVSDLSNGNMNQAAMVFNALAICRSLGFLNVTNPIATVNSVYGPGPGLQTRWWALPSCTSQTTFFQNCSGNYPFGYSPQFSHTMDTGIDCYPPPFTPITTLVSGGAPWKGRIMYQYSQFIVSGSICNDFFKHNHFSWNAVCRSAGFLNVTFARYVHYGPAASHLPISLDDVVCTQKDLFLENCTHRLYGENNCHHGEDAGVDCYPPPEVTAPWQFRLADGTAATNGRVEMRPSGAHPWGSICAGPYYNHTVAAWEAACRSVGIANPPRARWRYFGKGPDTVYLDNVSCAVSDMTLVDCDRFPLGSYRCSPSEVAGVDCDAPLEAPQQWQFRLVDGWTATSGRLEMRPDSATAWGGVCRHGLQHSDALRTVCRSTGHAAATRPLLFRPPGRAMPLAQPFYLDDATCNTTTPYLSNCSYAPLYAHDCDPQWDALFVECMPTLTAEPTTTHSASRPPMRTATVQPTPTGGWPKAPRTLSLNASQTLQTLSASNSPSTNPTLSDAQSQTIAVETPARSGTLTPSGSRTAKLSAPVATRSPSPFLPSPHATSKNRTVTISRSGLGVISGATTTTTTTTSPPASTSTAAPTASVSNTSPCPVPSVLEVSATVLAFRGPQAAFVRLPAPLLNTSTLVTAVVVPVPPHLPAGLLDVGTGIECRPSSPDMLRCTLTILDEKALTAAVVVPLVLHTALLGASGCAGGVEVRISLMLLPAASGDALLAAASVFATSAAVSAPFAFVADPTAFDSMAVVVALLSRCASVTDTARARWARYLLSPLIDLGPAVVGLIHALAPMVILVSHATVVFASARLEKRDTMHFTHRPAEAPLPSPLLTAASRWRFPGASMAAVVLLYPGAAWALTAHITEVSMGSHTMVWLMVLLCVFLVAVPVGAAFCLIRVDVCAAFTAYPAPDNRSNGRAKAALRWACVPRGVWGPDASWRSFGLLHGLSAGRRESARMLLLPAACAALLLVCALVGAPSRADTCRGAHAAAAVIVFVGTAALVLSATGTFATPLTAALTIVGGLSLGALLAAQAAGTSDTADAVKAAAVLTNAAAGILRAINTIGLWLHRRSSPPPDAAPEVSIGLDALECPPDAILNDISSEQDPSVAVDVL